jgi:hypothetical protein
MIHEVVRGNLAPKVGAGGFASSDAEKRGPPEGGRRRMDLLRR